MTELIDMTPEEIHDFAIEILVVIREDKGRPWREIIKAREIRACEKCSALIANTLLYGRTASKTNPNICECCA